MYAQLSNSPVFSTSAAGICFLLPKNGGTFFGFLYLQCLLECRILAQCSSQDLAQPGTSGPGTQFPTGSHFSPSLPQPGTIFFFFHIFLFTYNFFFLHTLFGYFCTQFLGHIFYFQFLYLGKCANFLALLLPHHFPLFLRHERYINKIRNNVRHNAS